MQISPGIIEGVIIVVASAAIIGMFAVLRAAVKMFSKVPAEIKAQKDQLAWMGKVLRHVFVAQEVQTDALYSSLTCQKEGRCNGSVDNALRAIDETKKKTRDFVAKIMAEEE
jgi:hypothetical protein